VKGERQVTPPGEEKEELVRWCGGLVEGRGLGRGVEGWMYRYRRGWLLVGEQALTLWFGASGWEMEEVAWQEL